MFNSFFAGVFHSLVCSFRFVWTCVRMKYSKWRGNRQVEWRKIKMPVLVHKILNPSSTKIDEEFKQISTNQNFMNLSKYDNLIFWNPMIRCFYRKIWNISYSPSRTKKETTDVPLKSGVKKTFILWPSDTIDSQLYCRNPYW